MSTEELVKIVVGLIIFTCVTIAIYEVLLYLTGKALKQPRHDTTFGIVVVTVIIGALMKGSHPDLLMLYMGFITPLFLYDFGGSAAKHLVATYREVILIIVLGNVLFTISAILLFLQTLSEPGLSPAMLLMRGILMGVPVILLHLMHVAEQKRA